VLDGSEAASGLALLRLDESRLPLHFFDAFDSARELKELAGSAVGRAGRAPMYLGSAVGWGCGSSPCRPE
jgi:hypothetical protein